MGKWQHLTIIALNLKQAHLLIRLLLERKWGAGQAYMAALIVVLSGRWIYENSQHRFRKFRIQLDQSDRTAGEKKDNLSKPSGRSK